MGNDGYAVFIRRWNPRFYNSTPNPRKTCHVRYSSLRLFRTIPSSRRGGLPLPKNLNQQCTKNLRDNRDGRRTHIAPDLDADAAKRCPREREHPFNVVWEPTGRKGEDRGFRVIELQENLEAVGAEPSRGLDAPVEGGFLARNGLVCVEDVGQWE